MAKKGRKNRKAFEPMDAQNRPRMGDHAGIIWLSGHARIRGRCAKE